MVTWMCKGQHKILRGLQMHDSSIRARTPEEAVAEFNRKSPQYDCFRVEELVVEGQGRSMEIPLQ